MTRDEAIKILSILKAAYPNSYKGMSKDEANGVVMIWTTQFAKFPANVVLIAVNKLISSSPFPPAISEVRKTMLGMYYESAQMLAEHNQYHSEGMFNGIGTPLDEKTLKLVQQINTATAQLRNSFSNELKLPELIGECNAYLLQDKNGA
jgi:hypothetical protein|nr:MAG TPA: replisome organizer [Caudoviricetes sp.]